MDLRIDFAFLTALPIGPSIHAEHEVGSGPSSIEVHCLDDEGESVSRSLLPLEQVCIDRGRRAPSSDETFHVHSAIPFPEGTTNLDFRMQGQPIGSMRIAPDALNVTFHVDQEEGSHFVTAYWTISNPVEAMARFLVLYTADDGASWLPVHLSASGETSCALDLQSLPGGEICRLALLAWAGGATAETYSDDFAVASKGLVCSIITPADGAHVLGPSILVAGQAFDVETGRFTENLVWLSDTIGREPLAQGQTAILELPAGRHVLTLEADEGSASASVTIDVGDGDGGAAHQQI